LCLVAILAFFLIVNSPYSDASDKCLSMVQGIEEQFSNISLVPGGIEGQIQINKEKSGLRRFKRVGWTLLMDAERVPLLSKKRKEIFPIQNRVGKLSGVHIAVRTFKKYHTGVEVFDSSISSGGEDIDLQLFRGSTEPFYFKNFKLKPVPYVKDSIEGDTWLLSHGEDRSVEWSHHSFLYPQIINFRDDLILNLFFETDFDNTNAGEGLFIKNWLENSLSGPRIDTCVYFMVEQDQ